jgi:hypothetical protein
MYQQQQQPFGVPLYTTPSPMRAAAPMQRPGFGVPLYATPVPQLPWGPAVAVRSPAGTIVAPAGTIRSGGSRWLGGPDTAGGRRLGGPDTAGGRRLGGPDTAGGRRLGGPDTKPFGLTTYPGHTVFSNPVYQVFSFATHLAAIYHGYKRNHGSIGWAIGWAFVPAFIAAPLMLAQGFAKPAR